MKSYDKKKINNFTNNNHSNINTNINSINLEDCQFQSKCDSLLNSYDILKIILSPNLSFEKNQFMEMIIDLIKSQIKIFINILNLKDQKTIFDILNTNNQNLSKQITEIYNSSILVLSSNEFSNKEEINDNKVNSSLSLNNKYNSSIKDNINKKEDNKIKIEQIKQINNKSHESPIKININNKDNLFYRNTPLGLSSAITSQTFTSQNHNKNSFNIHTYENCNNNEKNIKSYSTLKHYKNDKLYATEKKKNKKEYKETFIYSKSKSISNINKNDLVNDNSQYINNTSVNNHRLVYRNSKKRFSNINKYQNIKSKVALYLKREDDFINKRMNFQLHKNRAYSSNKTEGKKEVFSLTESQDIYQLLPRSLKIPLDEYIQKQQNIIFNEKVPSSNKQDENNKH